MRQLGLLLGLTASIALAVYIVLWSRTVGYPFPVDKSTRVVAVNSPLSGQAVATDAMAGGKHTVSLAEKHLAWDLGRQLLGGLIAVLVLLGVLRPMMRHLASSAVAKQAAVSGEDDKQQDQVMLSDGEAMHFSRADEDEMNLEFVKTMVSQEPRRVAQVVKQWLNES